MRSPNRTILYVDDDRDSREMICFLLRQADPAYEITAVANGNAALALIAAQPFDLYILDFLLPEISGIDICRRIRETDKIAPILFFSAISGKPNREAAETAGATAYLVKPNDLDSLTETVKLLLDRDPFESEPLFRSSGRAGSAGLP